MVLSRCTTEHQITEVIETDIISSSRIGEESGCEVGVKQLLRTKVMGKTVYLERTSIWGSEECPRTVDEYKVISVDKEPFGKANLSESAQAFLEQFAKNGFQGNPIIKITQEFSPDGSPKGSPTIA